MKQPRTKLLPTTPGDKGAAIFGYLVAGFTFLLAIGYAMPQGACMAPNRDAIARDAIVIAFVHLAISFGLLWLVQRLNKPHGPGYRTTVVVIASVLPVLLLIFAMGYGFGVGTACTT